MDIEATGSTKGTQSNTDASIYGSQALLQNGTLEFKGNIFYNGGKGNTALGTAENDQLVADVIGLAGNSNTFDVDPLLLDTSSRDGVVAPFPYSDANNTSPALTAGVTLPGSIFGAAAYKGAFASSAASDNWLAGWSSIGGDSASAGSTPILAVDLNGSSSGSGTGTIELINISTNGYVSGASSASGSMMSAGFVVSGTGTQTIFIKAEPTTESGVTDPLSDPQITVYNFDRSSTKGSNDDWKTQSTASDLTAIQALDSHYLPVSDASAAVILTLTPGAYLIDVSGKNGATGKALVAVNSIAN
jgi:hypothetical protein